MTRGGNWFAPQGFCRSAVRDGENLPQLLNPALGFRLILLDEGLSQALSINH